VSRGGHLIFASVRSKEAWMNESLQVRRETYVAAPPSVVFAYLTDPEKIVSWMGSEAETEPRLGGMYLLKGVGPSRRGAARGAFREVVPVHRLAYSFGWEGDAEVPPGSTLVELDLIDKDGGTLLRITHSGLPTKELCDGHARGWAHYMGRLGVAAAGGDPGADRGPSDDM
jgi:uncharacterized protein YndB with AHSA1/START domain